MAYITADDVRAIRNALKEKFPKYKFGARKSSGSLAVEVTIKQGPVDFISNYNSVMSQRPGTFVRAGDYLDVNQYWYKEHFDGEAQKVIGEVINIIKTAPDRKWYDNSDAMSDYFDTAYYFNIGIGSWKAPYILVK